MFTRLLHRIAAPLRAGAAAWPGQCLICHAWPTTTLCGDCVARFAPAQARCTTCALPVPPGVTVCGQCLRKPPPMAQCLAAVDYRWPWSMCVARWKFEGDVGLTRPLATLLQSTPGVRAALDAADLVLPMPGRHNVSNATAAIVTAHRIGMSEADIRRGLGQFGGVKRRFTHTGTANGIEVFDDYGHHPVEIRAVLSAARSAAKGRVIAVMQPHRFSRLQSLFDDFAACFNDADTVILAPVYAAGEEPIPGVDSRALLETLKLGGHRDARLIDGPAELAPLVASIATPGDMVVFLGAGSVTQWAYALPKELEALASEPA